MSPRLHIPITSDAKTIGTIVILIMFIKIAPKGPIHVLANSAPSSPSSRPAITPITSPAIIRVDSFIIMPPKFVIKYNNNFVLYQKNRENHNCIQYF